MYEIIKGIIDWLQHFGPKDHAKLAAYMLAPGSILIFTILNMSGERIGTVLSQPILLSELKTEFTSNGKLIVRKGFAVVIEPSTSEFRIELSSTPNGIWSSLDESQAFANLSRLALDKRGLNGKTPFLGVTDPVVVVVESQIGKTIQVPGGIERVDDLLLRSQRSISLMTSTLIACVFAFGMSSASSLTPMEGKQ